MKEKKYKYLLKNIGFLTISNFGSKVLSFLLIPIYTSVLSTSDYGKYDIYNTTISLLIPIITINIIESVMRFSLEKKANHNSIFRVGFNYIFCSSIVIVFLLSINYYFNFIPIFKEYWIYFILLYIGQVTYDLLSQFSRGIEKISIVAVAGFINSASIILLNIYFLVCVKKGLKGYFCANILGYFIPIVFMSVYLKIWKYLKNSKTDKKLEKEMKTYSKPLVFNTLSWWITNVSDRYIVTFFCGIAANGIYSLSYKLPSILNVFQSIFSQAWTISAVKEFSNSESAKNFFSKVYNIYNIGMVLSCSLIITFNIPLAKILFSKDFFLAWKYAPYLMISVVFGSLSGCLGGVFSATKKSNIYAKTTIIGSIINIIFNIILVIIMGPIGAAISTLISYIIVWILRISESKKLIDLDLNLLKNIFSYIILIVQALLCNLCYMNKIYYIFQIICLIIIILMYSSDIKIYLKKGDENENRIE